MPLESKINIKKIVDQFCAWSHIDPKYIDTNLTWLDNYYNGYKIISFNCLYLNFIDRNGNIVFPDQWFSSIKVSNNPSKPSIVSIIDTKTGEKSNLIDSNCNLLLKNWASYIGPYYKDYPAIIGFGNKKNYIDKEGHIISDIWFDEADAFSNDRAVVLLNNSYNMIRPDGSLIYKNWYNDIVKNYQGGGYDCIWYRRKCNLFTPDGKMVSKIWFDEIERLEESEEFDWYEVTLDNKRNILKQDGSFVSDVWLKHLYVTDDKENNVFALIQFGDNKENFIDYEGNIMYKTNVDNVLYLPDKEGYALVELNGKWNYVGMDGSVLYDWTSNWREIKNKRMGHYMVNLNESITNQNSIFNHFCNWSKITKPEEIEYLRNLTNGGEAEITKFSGRFRMVHFDGFINFIDKSGHIIFNEWFDSVSTLSNESGVPYRISRYRGQFQKEYNLIDDNCNILLPTWVSDIDDFRGGFCVIRIYSDGKTKSNYVDANGILLSDIWFDRAWEFENEDQRKDAPVRLNGKYNVIKSDGTFRYKKWFDSIVIGRYGDKFDLVKVNDKYNIINADTSEFLSKIWADEITEDYLTKGLILQLNDKYNLLKQDGSLLSKTWYDELDTKKYNGNIYVFVRKASDKYNLLDYNGNELLNRDFYYLGSMDENGYALIALDATHWNNINVETRKLFFNKWETSWSMLWQKRTDAMSQQNNNVIAEAKEIDQNFIKQHFFNSRHVSPGVMNLNASLTISNFHNGYKKLFYLNCFNFLSPLGEIVFDKWFDEVYDIDFKGEPYCVVLPGKGAGEHIYNLLDYNCNLLLPHWVDSIDYFYHGVAPIRYQNKMNLVDFNGNIISKIWVDSMSNLSQTTDQGDFNIFVVLNDKVNYMNCRGELKYKTWFDEISTDYWDNLDMVKLHGRYNIIKEDETYLFKLWFDKITIIGTLASDYRRVILEGKQNFVRKDGTFFSKIWFRDFHFCQHLNIKEKLIIIYDGNYFYLLGEDGNLKINKKFDYLAENGVYGYLIASIGENEWNFIDGNGNTMFNTWCDSRELEWRLEHND